MRRRSGASGGGRPGSRSRSRGQLGAATGGVFLGGTYNTGIKYRSTKGQDQVTKNGVAYNADTLLHCITAMPPYERKSLEELRLEDYRYVARHRGGNFTEGRLFSGGQQWQNTHQESRASITRDDGHLVYPNTPTATETNETMQQQHDLALEMKSLQQQVSMIEQQLGSRENRLPSVQEQELAAKDGEIAKLQSQLQMMMLRASRAERMVVELQEVLKPELEVDTARVRQLERELLETRVLYTTTIDDYDILGLVHDSGEEGLVFRVKCNKSFLPSKEKVYILKVLTNWFQNQTQTQTRQEFQSECNLLCQLPTHENIIRMWAFFYDRANPDISPQFSRMGENARAIALFLLMDEHPTNMMEYVGLLVNDQGPEPETVLRWCRDLLCGLLFLENHCIVHRDLKMDNLLLATNGRLVISDFRKAVILDTDFTLPFTHAGTDIGGNRAHISPEILRAKPGRRRTISYSKQPVWAAGVLAYELSGHPSPFSADTIDQCAYLIDQLPPLEHTYCRNSTFSQPLPKEFTGHVRWMLDIEPSSRPSLATSYGIILSLVK